MPKSRLTMAKGVAIASNVASKLAEAMHLPLFHSNQNCDAIYLGKELQTTSQVSV